MESKCRPRILIDYLQYATEDTFLVTYYNQDIFPENTCDISDNGREQSHQITMDQNNNGK